MNRYCLFALAALWGLPLWSQSGDVDSCFLEGRFLFSEGWQKKVWLLETPEPIAWIAAFTPWIVDSAEVDEDGRFCFCRRAGKTPGQLYRVLFLREGQTFTDIMRWPYDEVILFEMPADTGRRRVVVSGGKPGTAWYPQSGHADLQRAWQMMSLLQYKRRLDWIQRQLFWMEDGRAEDLERRFEEKLSPVLDQVRARLWAFADTTTSPVWGMLALYELGLSQMQTFSEREKAHVRRLYEQWRRLVPEHEWYSWLDENMEKWERLAPGRMLPPLEGRTPSEEEWTLDALHGKVILIDFWTSWCHPCRVGARDVLEPLYERYHDKGFEIVAISLDRDREAWLEALEQDGHPWPQVRVPEAYHHQVQRDYFIDGYPTLLLVDEQGKILAAHIFFSDLEKWLQQLLDDHIEGE